MPNFFIHMGTHKTGSSYIQAFLAKNTEALEHAGIIYPNDPQVELARKNAITSGNARHLANFLSPGGSLRYKKVITALLEANTGEDILFSSETFGNPDPEKVKTLQAIVRSKGYRLRCCFYVRSIVGYALSQHSQLIKRHAYPKDFSHYLRAHFEIPFQTIFQTIDCFGTDSVELFNYDTNKTNLAQHFVSHFLKRNSDEFAYENRVINRSLDEVEIESLRYLNSIHLDAALSTIFSDRLIYSRDSATHWFISPEDYAYIQEKYVGELSSINRFLSKKQSINFKSEDITVESRTPVKLSVANCEVLREIAKREKIANVASPGIKNKLKTLYSSKLKT